MYPRKKFFFPILSFILVYLLVGYQGYGQDLSSLYEKVNPAVVVIYTQQKDVRQLGGETQEVNSQGLGSGFLISPTRIMTAAHVVDVAEKLLVRFTDGVIIEAKVVSSFKKPDVALLELATPKENPKMVPLGDSDLSKIGEQVLVVGAPFGLAHSLSSGYISGRLKEDSADNPFTISEYLQTDAAINKGNSGGPMFNLKGEVIGIVSHIKTISGGFEGIGFAASSNMAKRLLLENNIPWAGAEMIPLTQGMLRALNVPRNGGLLVQKVVSSSLYGKLGVKGGTIPTVLDGREMVLGGDVILTINDIPFEMNQETLKRLGEYATNIKEGDPIILEIMREGEVLILRSDRPSTSTEDFFTIKNSKN